MESKLIKKSWLQRTLEVSGENQTPLKITYSGNGKGSESIIVNDCEKIYSSRGIWYVPELTFEHENEQIMVEVRVWPWLAIRSLRVSIDGEVAYSEGQAPYSITRKSEIIQAVNFYSIIFGSLVMFVLVIEYAF